MNHPEHILRTLDSEHLVPIELPHLGFLHLFRPSTLDLILTKMMRVDPQDRSDIEFLLRNADLEPEAFDVLIRDAEIPDIPEIHQAFEINREWLHQLLSNA